MKKRALIIFLILNSLLLANVKYKKTKVLNSTVYFPKTTSEYIEMLLKSEDHESYFNLSEIYFNLNKLETSKIYLIEYEKKSDEYLKISKMYNKLEDYLSEIKALEKYLKGKSIIVKKEYYEYIKSLIYNKSLNLDIKQYSVTDIEVLFSYLKSDKEFYDYYNSKLWSKYDNKKIVEKLLDIDLEKYFFHKKIFNDLATESKMIEYQYKKITDVLDKKGYYKYYERLEELEKEIIFRDDFEKLYYYEYIGENEKFIILFEELINKYVLDNDFKSLYILYKINNDFKIIYNLAFEKDKYFYEFINLMSKDKYENSFMLDLINEFFNKFKDSQFDSKVALLKINYIEDSKEKLILIDKILKEKYDEDLFKEKLSILKENLDLLNSVDVKSYESELKEFILNKYPIKEYVELYILKLESEKRQYELYNELQNLDDKLYFFNICIKYNFKIPAKYNKELINYYFDNELFDKLLEFKERLEYKHYKYLIENGKYEYLEGARKKFPLEELWIDKGIIENFYFNRNYVYFDEEMINQLILKENKNDAEQFYLAKYYYFVGSYEKSLETLAFISSKYNGSEEINSLILENNKQIKKFTNEEMKTNVELNYYNNENIINSNESIANDSMSDEIQDDYDNNENESLDISNEIDYNSYNEN